MPRINTRHKSKPCTISLISTYSNCNGAFTSRSHTHIQHSNVNKFCVCQPWSHNYALDRYHLVLCYAFFSYKCDMKIKSVFFNGTREEEMKNILCIPFAWRRNFQLVFIEIIIWNCVMFKCSQNWTVKFVCNLVPLRCARSRALSDPLRLSSDKISSKCHTNYGINKQINGYFHQCCSVFLVFNSNLQSSIVLGKILSLFFH